MPGWHRMETTDLVHMGPESPIGVVGGTGDLIQDKDGVWHLFACIFPEGKQFVTHYISPDGCLDHWELQEEDTLAPMGRSTTAPTGGTPGSSTGRTWGSIGCTCRPG